MTWLEGNAGATKPAGERLRELIEKPEILGVPGTHNGLAGMLAKEAGVEAPYISGGDRKSTRLHPSYVVISYAVFCLKK